MASQNPDRALSAKPPFRILVVGVGSIGERHLRCFQKTGAVETGFCEPVGELRDRIAQAYGARGFASLDEALASREWDGAVICTPAHRHLALAEQCLEAGQAVLIEKPLAVALGEAEAFAERWSPARVFVAYIHRSVPVMRLAWQRIREGCIGTPLHVTHVSGQNFPTFRPQYRDIYYARHETGGGAVQDSLTHHLHCVEWLIGRMESLVCDAKHLVLEGVEVEDTVNLLAHLQGGALAAFALNQFQAPNEIRLQAHGTAGSLCVELPANRLGLMPSGGSEWEWEQLPAMDRDTAFLAQAHAFLSALNGLPTDLCPLADALQSLRVNVAALESARTGARIAL
jgi:predicted dehydrogenase